MILNPSSSFTLWKIYPLLMSSSLSLGSTPVKKTEVAAALVISRHLFPILKGVFFNILSPLLTVNPKPPGMRTHLRWVKAFVCSSSLTHSKKTLFHLFLVAAVDNQITAMNSFGYKPCVFCLCPLHSYVYTVCECQTCSRLTLTMWPLTCFQYGMFWMCVRRRTAPPTHKLQTNSTHTLQRQCLPVAIFDMARDKELSMSSWCAQWHFLSWN